MTKYQFHNRWFDQTRALPHELPHTRDEPLYQWHGSPSIALESYIMWFLLILNNVNFDKRGIWFVILLIAVIICCLKFTKTIKSMILNSHILFTEFIIIMLIMIIFWWISKQTVINHCCHFCKIKTFWLIDWCLTRPFDKHVVWYTMYTYSLFDLQNCFTM